jgi:hypothetical protein
MVAAIEIYNKPGFPYRAETFAILAGNGWELLFKAKWLAANDNKERSLYVVEDRLTAAGAKSKKHSIKKTRSGNPFTYSLDYLGKKLVEQKMLDVAAWSNIEALIELRDCAVHFYNKSPAFVLRLQEIGTACLKNFAAAIREWFDRDLSGLNLYLMPLSFVEMPNQIDALVLNAHERNFLTFLDSLEKPNPNPNSAYSITVNVEVKFTRSKAKDALNVQMTNDPNAPAVRVTEEQIREKYPWDYSKLTSACRTQLPGFKEDSKYHAIRKKLAVDPHFGTIRYLDPGNPKSSRKPFFNPNIMKEMVKHYTSSKGS